MRVVETLVVRDEADIVDEQLTYHLNAGVDFVIATDHESRDGTSEILESYARQGYLHRIPAVESGGARDGVAYEHGSSRRHRVRGGLGHGRRCR